MIAASVDDGEVPAEVVLHEEDHDDRERTDEARQLRARARALGHDRARGRRAHREALEETGRHVGRAEGADLPVGVDVLAAPRRQAARQRRGVGEHRRTRCPRRPRAASRLRASPTSGKGRTREAGRDRADDRHAVRGEVEGAHRDRSTRPPRPGRRAPSAASGERRGSRRATRRRRRARRARSCRRAARARTRRPRSTSPCASELKPNSFGSCPTKTITAIPLRKPTRTGFDRSSARTPRRAKPAAMHSAPMSSASIEASATALAGSAWASTSGRSAAAISGPSAESGPSTRMRDGPNSAYARSASTVVYKPVTGGKPGQLGVRHALRDEQRGEHQPRRRCPHRATPAGRCAPGALPAPPWVGCCASRAGTRTSRIAAVSRSTSSSASARRSRTPRRRASRPRARHPPARRSSQHPPWPRCSRPHVRGSGRRTRRAIW